MTSLAVDKELFKKSFLGGAGKLSVGSDAGRWDDLVDADIDDHQGVAHAFDVVTARRDG